MPITFGAITRFAAWAAERFEIEPGTPVLSYCGLNFDLSILEVWTTLLHGGCVVLVAAEDATRPDQLRDLVLEHDVEVLQGVPMLTSLLVEAGTELPSVRHVILTGDATPPTLLAQLPGPFTNARFSNVYGCTETNDSFVHEIDVAQRRPGALGRSAARRAPPDRRERSRGRGRRRAASCGSRRPSRPRATSARRRPTTGSAPTASTARAIWCGATRPGCCSWKAGRTRR